jgi:hypothetical protein
MIESSCRRIKFDPLSESEIRIATLARRRDNGRYHTEPHGIDPSHGIEENCCDRGLYHHAVKSRCPLYPRKPTLPSVSWMSAIPFVA